MLGLVTIAPSLTMSMPAPVNSTLTIVFATESVIGNVSFVNTYAPASSVSEDAPLAVAVVVVPSLKYTFAVTSTPL